eukprot:PhF_6_TR6073/c0_g1_i7/m.8833
MSVRSPIASFISPVSSLAGLSTCSQGTATSFAAFGPASAIRFTMSGCNDVALARRTSQKNNFFSSRGFDLEKIFTFHSTGNPRYVAQHISCCGLELPELRRKTKVWDD